MTLYRSIFILCYLLSSACITETVVLANGEWRPYQSESLKHYGIVTHIVTEAFKSQGIETEYIFLPWARAFRRAENGVYNGPLVWSIADTNKDIFYVGEPVLKGETVFFHLSKNDFDWQQLSDLKGLRMGAVLGYQYKSELLDTVEVQLVKDNLQNFQKLLLGRIDIAYADRLVGLNTMHKYLTTAELERISVHPLAYAHETYSLILTRKLAQNERLIKLFNLGLSQLKASGKLNQYMRDHLDGKYKPD